MGNTKWLAIFFYSMRRYEVNVYIFVFMYFLFFKSMVYVVLRFVAEQLRRLTSNNEHSKQKWNMMLYKT